MRGPRGDLRGAEAVLTSQAAALNAIFTRLAGRAEHAEYLDHMDRFMRLALKAQSQCRATLETLALLKNPPVFARQANIAHGPQQVNNRLTLARAGDSESEQNKLLEKGHGERLDTQTASTSSASDKAMAPVGAFDRSENP